MKLQVCKKAILQKANEKRRGQGAERKPSKETEMKPFKHVEGNPEVQYTRVQRKEWSPVLNAAETSIR